MTRVGLGAPPPVSKRPPDALRWPATTRPFRPYPLTHGGHRQTLLGYALRRALVWTPPVADLVVDAGGDVRLLLRVSWQPDRERRPTLLLVHGLEGSDRSGYMLATGITAWERGWNVARMNLRGAGGTEALCARLYNAGQSDDLLAVLHALAALTPRLSLIGFSLGASLALLSLGRHPERVPPGFEGVVAVSPPLDLGGCADLLARPANRIYAHSFMQSLRQSYARRQRLLPELYEFGRERAARNLREYDDLITAPYGGYAGATDYYARSSAGPHLGALQVPTLILAALDDPMVSADSVRRFALPARGHVVRETPTTGGHVGFVAPASAPGRLWAAERALDFLSQDSCGGQTWHR